MRCLWLPAFALTAVLSAASAAVADDGLSRVELAKLGKAATALVECPLPNGKGYGTAFCVHPSGLFVTNEHVVERCGPGGTVTLVLNPGLKTQRVVQAKVVRGDKDEDLALLHIDDGKDLPALALGSSDGVSELMEVVAFGFPFGTALDEKHEYPSVSVNIGSVTALRMKDGALHRIQVDIVLNPGNSGGPVLDKNGKVLGVVVAGVRGAGVNFVIPVDRVSRFLARPEVEFRPPALTRDGLGKPAEFRVKVASLLPSDKAPDVELILGDHGKRRIFSMAKGDDAYRVKAVPLPPRQGPAPVRVTVTYPNGSITGDVTDRIVKVGGKKIKLGDLRSLQRQPAPHVVLRDGHSVGGAVEGLDALEILLGKETLRAPLAEATAVSFDRARGPDAVACTIVVRRDGKEVARLGATLTATEQVAGSRPDSGPAVGAVRPPALDADKVVRLLPASFDDVAVGGAGRFLIFHLPKVRKLAVFDVGEAKVVFYMPLTEDNVKFAAGRDKLVVSLPGGRVLQRWSLATFEREAVAPSPVEDEVTSMVMGASSDGPVLVNGQLVDLQTLKLLPITYPGGRKGIDCGPTTRIRASGDGTVFGSWKTDQSPSGLNTFVLTGKELKQYYVHNTMNHVTPGPDGKVVFTGRGLFTPEAKRLEGDNLKGDAYCVPASQGNFFLTVRILDSVYGLNLDGKKRVGVNVYMLGIAQAIAQLPQVEFWEGMNGWDRESVPVDQRIHFIPAAKVIVILPPSNDRLVLYRFDPEEALEKSGVDYLLVTSQPPAKVKRGDVFTYQMTVKSKKGGVRYRLDSGPEGMTVSKDGLVTWKVPADWSMPNPDVLLSVTDSAKQECFHSFKIGVTN